MRIPLQEIEFHPSSHVDPHGRVFQWADDIYRGVSEPHAQFYKELLARDSIKKLMRHGALIETELTDFKLDGYDLVLKHRRLPIVSYPYEWCFHAFKDAALLFLELQRALMMEGLILQDAHPWNIVFDSCRPIYVDFTSIKPMNQKTGWERYDEFVNFFVNPLVLMSEGHGRIARLCLQDFISGVSSTEVSTLSNLFSRRAKRIGKSFFQTRIGATLKPSIKRSFLTVKKALPSEATLSNKLVQREKSRVNDLQLSTRRTLWSDYCCDNVLGAGGSDKWTVKEHSVHAAISRLRPNSIADIACNRGWHSQLAAAQGCAVIGIDNDEVCIDGLYLEAKRRGSRICPVVMNILNPSPGLGLRGNELPSAVQRLKCEMALALAIVHHLVFGQNRKFDYIASAFAEFAAKYLIVEFISREDEYVKHWWSQDYAWYTLENFETALKRHFSTIERYPSYPDSRLLLVCER